VETASVPVSARHYNSPTVGSSPTPLPPATITTLGAVTDRHVIVRAMRAGLWIWPSFALLDAYMCFVAYPGAPFWLFVVYRIALEVVMYAIYRLGLREDVNLDRLFLWHSRSYRAAAFIISLMAMHLGGIRSPYMHGISIVALVWAALEPMPWRRAMTTFIGIGASFPVVMGIGAAVSPAARATWLTPDALIVFVSNYVFVVASCVLSVLLSDSVWRAQQQARTFGSYQLESLLGRGGMGEVWRARHRLLARRAAIKLVRQDAFKGRDDLRLAALARFEREAQATASLRSPHTVELYDFGVSDTGTFYYVMELLEGMDAAALVERFGPLPPERVIHLVSQVCDSLGEAHAAGLVHRDIKPSNLFICRYGRTVDFMKVLDFGLVKPRTDDDSHLTTELSVKGTPAFMAPEQAQGDRAIDARSDIYAVGCVAYWLLTGQRVFKGDNAMQVLVQHAYSAPTPLSEHIPNGIPAELNALVMSCLEKDPARRPQSADAVAEALAAIPVDRPWTQTRAREWWRGTNTSPARRALPPGDGDHSDPSAPNGLHQGRTRTGRAP
jgi:serine/threonine protein kinase